MILLNALTRGAISFLVIMSLGICGLMLRDGVDVNGVADLMSYLPETDMEGIEQTVDSLKAALQRNVSSWM
jgi:hypothetical protein